MLDFCRFLLFFCLEFGEEFLDELLLTIFSLDIDDW